MAISSSKKGNLVDTVLVETSNKEKKVPETKVDSPENERIQIEKKRGFLASTIDELKLTRWPSFGYVARWSVVIILFTALFAIVIGFFDNVFTASIKFVDCTSAEGRNRPLNECGDDFLKNLTNQ